MQNAGNRAYPDAMPVNITIRNVPDEVRDKLVARAARSGRSLQEFLSAELVRIANTPSAADAAARGRLAGSSSPPCQRTRSSPLCTRGVGDNGCRERGIRARGARRISGCGRDRVERRHR